MCEELITRSCSEPYNFTLQPQYNRPSHYTYFEFSFFKYSLSYYLIFWAYLRNTTLAVVLLQEEEGNWKVDFFGKKFL
jgi:hypothetical protein